MRRAAALIPLSRDHHRALAQALWLERAQVGAAGRVVAGFLEFWEREGEQHFAAEERALMPVCRRRGGELAALAERMLDEHIWIRSQVRRLRASQVPEPLELQELADSLRKHVRFEERILFPLVESTLEPDELSVVAARVQV